MTDEIIPPDEQERAADGGNVPGAAKTTGQFLDVLEDGGFSHEVYEKMKELGFTIEEVASASGGKAKGKIVLTIELTKEDGAFRVASNFKVTAPEMPRPRSILWANERGDFTRFPPGQRQMFGVNQIGGGKLRQV